MITPPIVFCLIAFLFGSIPFGFIIAKVFGKKDLQKVGSGNIGATNVSRVMGVWPWGVTTLVLDTLKGVLAVLFVLPSIYAYWIDRFHIAEWDWSVTGFWTVGLFAVLGHCYSPWLKFKGGKGVATGFGVFLVLSPIAAAIGALVFGWSFYFKRTGSLASLLGMTAAFIFHFLGRELSPELIPILGIYWVILIRHDANIESLLRGQEPQF